MTKMKAGWSASRLLGSILALLIAGGVGAQEGSPLDNMTAFLKEYGKFSKKELSKMEAGVVLSKTLDSDINHEVVVVAVIRVDVPRSFFLSNYGEEIPIIETQEVLGWGRLDDPPTIDNLKDFALDPRDVQALEECTGGDCNMKLPAAAMERFKNEIDWTAADAESKANDLTRQMLVDYAKAYLVGGNTGLVEYHDQENPVRLADEFMGLLEQSPYLFQQRPEFFTYLQNFPKGELEGVTDVLYWAREDVGANYKISSLNHVTVVIPKDASHSPLLASKQIYANHYFEAGLTLTALVDNQNESVYLVHLNRARVDALRRGGFTTKIIRSKLKGGMKGLTGERLAAVKEHAERLYKGKN